MSKVKISDIAIEVGKKSKDILDLTKACGLNVKTANSSVDEDVAMIIAGVFLGEISREDAIEKVALKVAPKAPKKSAKSSSSAEKKMSKDTSVSQIDKGDKEVSRVQNSELVKKSAKKTIATESQAESLIAQEGTPSPVKKAVEPPEQKLKVLQKRDIVITKKGATSESEELKGELLESTQAQESQDKPEQGEIEAMVDKVDALLDDKSTKEKFRTPFLRRTSIQIVRKTASPEPKRSAKYSMKEVLDNLNIEKIEKKPKKAKQKAIAHRDSEKKINLLEGRDVFNHRDSSEDEALSEVVLFDLNEAIQEPQPQKQEIIDRAKVQRKSTWISDGSIQRKRRKKPKSYSNTKEQEKVKVVSIPEEVRVYEFADLANINIGEVIKTLMQLGMMVTKNDFLDRDAIEILCGEFDITYEIKDSIQDFDVLLESSEDEEGQVARAPVVVLMGHVDHGKTTLLDTIREMKVAASEAGGITQHIGAYSINRNGKDIAFIDTPGHSAFSSMRSRGAKVTDISIVVIAADDGVKEQTIEAFKHAKESGSQIIVAMTKIDKENINLDRLKSQCADLGYVPSEWGGEYDFIGVSARSGVGIDDLLDTILVQAEILELRANPSAKARAMVLEGSMDKGRGAIATVIVQNGTLRVGDPIVADTRSGRVRMLLDDMGRSVKELAPSGVGVVVGLSEIPSAGCTLSAVESDSLAKEIAQKRSAYNRQKELSKSTKVSFDELSSMILSGDLKVLPLIIKADTQGSLEAIKASVGALSNDEVQIQIVSSGVGGITESDLSLAFASKNSTSSISAMILGFNIRPTGAVKSKSKELGITINTYSVIYALIDEISALVNGMMKPDTIEENLGQAEVREVFKIKNVGVVAGCFVSDGVIERSAKARVIRAGVVISSGNIVSLKRFKDDAKEVTKGYECGIMIDGVSNVEIGDVIESYKESIKSR